MYSGAKDLLNEFPLVAQTDLQLAEDQSMHLSKRHGCQRKVKALE